MTDNIEKSEIGCKPIKIVLNNVFMGILCLSDEYLDYNSKLVTEVGVEEIAEEDRLSNSATYPSLNIISSILDLLSY